MNIFAPERVTNEEMGSVEASKSYVAIGLGGGVQFRWEISGGEMQRYVDISVLHTSLVASFIAYLFYVLFLAKISTTHRLKQISMSIFFIRLNQMFQMHSTNMATMDANIYESI